MIYHLVFSRGKAEPISNLLLCGGAIPTIFPILNSIEAEGWIIVQENTSIVSHASPVETEA